MTSTLIPSLAPSIHEWLANVDIPAPPHPASPSQHANPLPSPPASTVSRISKKRPFDLLSTSNSTADAVHGSLKKRKIHRSQSLNNDLHSSKLLSRRRRFSSVKSDCTTLDMLPDRLDPPQASAPAQTRAPPVDTAGLANLGSQPPTLPPPSYPASAVPASTESELDPDTRIPETPHFVRNTLAKNGMWINGGRLQKDYTTFHAEIEDLLKTERRSPKAPKYAVAKEIVEWISKYYTLPEADFMAQFVPKLIPWSRMPISSFFPPTTDQAEAQVPPEVPPEEPPEIDVAVTFSEDGLICRRDAFFAKDFVPCWHQEERNKLTQAMKKEKGITTPQPDFIYGIWENQHPTYTPQDCDMVTRAIVGVVNYMMNPFFLIEGKRAGGDLVAAENQACRGGAALVNARRRLNRRAGQLDELGADPRSFVFSLTTDSTTAWLWIHWCELRRKGEGDPEFITAPDAGMVEYYHMDCLRLFILRRIDEIADLIGKLNNILDWGCVQRVGEIKKVLKRVWVKEKETAAIKAPESAKSPAGKRKRLSKGGTSSSSGVRS